MGTLCTRAALSLLEMHILTNSYLRVADKYEHNMRDYVYYSLYFDSIDTGDHNAIQKYVYELVSMESHIACVLSTV